MADLIVTVLAIASVFVMLGTAWIIVRGIK